MFTISHSVGENDSGELAMCQATLSIPHPTGYPLFVLIGFLFSKLPIPLSIILKLNILCSIWCALTIIVVIRICIVILNNFNLFLNPKGRFNHLISDFKPSMTIIASIFAGLMLAYSATFWLQSTRVEVYSLQIFIASLIILFTLKAYISYEKQPIESKGDILLIIKRWWLVFVLIGFGFANHMMTLYLIPATVVLYFFCTGISIKSIKSLLILFLITGLISLIFYLGLMVRANMGPQWSFGDPSGFTRLIEHVTAKKYSQLMMLGSQTLNEQSSKLLKLLSFNFSKSNFSTGEFSLSLFLGIAGLLLMPIFKKEFVLYFIVIIITAFTLSLSYKIPDINEYFLVPFMILSLLSIIPLIIILKILNYKKIRIVLFFLFLFISIQYLSNYNYANRSNTYFSGDFFKSSISSLPVNSVLLTEDWVNIISPGLYYQNVEKIRKDVTIISPNGLRMHEWYRRSQKSSLLENDKLHIQGQELFVGIDVMSDLKKEHFLSFPDNSLAVPEIYFYHIVFDNKYRPLNDDGYNIRFDNALKNDYELNIRTLLAFMLEQRIIYELNYNKIERANYYYKKLKKTFPSYNLSASTYIAIMKAKIL